MQTKFESYIASETKTETRKKKETNTCEEIILALGNKIEFQDIINQHDKNYGI